MPELNPKMSKPPVEELTPQQKIKHINLWYYKLGFTYMVHNESLTDSEIEQIWNAFKIFEDSPLAMHNVAKSNVDLQVNFTKYRYFSIGIITGSTIATTILFLANYFNKK